MLPWRIITEGTAIQVPPYALHRDPRYFFPNPDKFWPDRWLKQDVNIVLERNAFIPFSTGQASCPGKPLAMIQVRLVTYLFVSTFELSFEDGFDPLQWETGLLDRFSMDKGVLPIKLKRRSCWCGHGSVKAILDSCSKIYLGCVFLHHFKCVNMIDWPNLDTI